MAGACLFALTKVVGIWSWLMLCDPLSIKIFWDFGTEEDYNTLPSLLNLNSFYRSLSSSITFCFLSVNCSFMYFTCTASWAFCFYLTLKYSSSSSILERDCYLCSYWSWMSLWIAICFFSRYVSWTSFLLSSSSFCFNLSCLALSSFENILTTSLFCLYCSLSVMVEMASSYFFAYKIWSSDILACLSNDFFFWFR